MITRSFHTTKVIESLNSHVRKYTRKVTHWENSNIRYRWLASDLLVAEQKMNKVSNYKHLPRLRKAINSILANPLKIKPDFQLKLWQYHLYMDIKSF